MTQEVSHNNTSGGISVLICAHNPDPKVFETVLTSVAQLRAPKNLPLEIIIIDNCSSPSLGDRIEVISFLSSNPRSKIIKEDKTGLTHARLAGIREAKGDIIIFIDDDNEPSEDYLVTAVDCLARHPDIFALGPGKINVRFLGEVSKEFVFKYENVFQARQGQFLEYASIPGTQLACYPYGTGLILRREVAERYATAVLSGQLRSPGRQGRRLTSGEDTQMVWEAIKLGRAAGIAPNLRMVHIIPSARSNRDYIARQLYGTASSYLPAYLQSFPEMEKTVDFAAIRIDVLLLRLGKVVLRCLLKGKWLDFRVECARILGPVAGLLLARNQGSSHFVFFLVRRLGLD